MCDKVIVQNFDRGWGSLYSQKGLHLLASQKEIKLQQYRKARITGLKRSLRATDKYAYCLATFILYTSRNGFLKRYHTFKAFYIKAVKTKIQARIDVLTSRTGKKSQTASILCVLFGQNFDGGCDHHAILHCNIIWTR